MIIEPEKIEAINNTGRRIRTFLEDSFEHLVSEG